MAIQVAPNNCPICMSEDRKKQDANTWDTRLFRYALTHEDDLCVVHRSMLRSATSFFRRMVIKHFDKE